MKFSSFFLRGIYYIMSTSRPFAYNTGSTINGTYQVGDIAIGIDDMDYSGDPGPGGVKWWMGPDEDSNLVIANPVPTMDQPTPIGNVGTVGFQGTTFTHDDFLLHVNNWLGKNFTSPQSAANYLTLNGYWNSLDPLPKTAIYDGNTVAWFDSSDIDTIVKDGSDYVSLWRNKLENEGAEIIRNGSFINTDYWSLNEATINSGLLSINASQYGQVAINNGTEVCKSSTYYIYSYEIVTITSGQVALSLGGIGYASVDSTPGIKMGCYKTASNAGGNAWYIYAIDAGTIATIDNVSIKEVTGNHLYQLTGTNQPLWTSNGILFDGIDNFMKTVAFTFNQPEMVYLVGKYITLSGENYIIDGGGGDLNRMIISTSGDHFYIYAGSFEYISTPNTNYFILRVLYNSSNSFFKHDEESYLGLNVGSQNSGGITLGGDGPSGTYCGNIIIKEVIFRNISDTASDEQSIYDYLKTRYSL